MVARVPEGLVSTCIIGCDIGMATDPSAICVVRTAPGPGDYTAAHVVHLETLPLGTPYLQLAERLMVLREQVEPLARAPLVIDATGVGRAVWQLFVERGLCPTAVSYTAGRSSRYDETTKMWLVPKTELVSAIASLLERSLLRISPDLDETGELLREMQEFQLTVTANANITYGAGKGHDDRVNALALACWWMLRTQPRKYGGTGSGYESVSARRFKERGWDERRAERRDRRRFRDRVF